MMKKLSIYPSDISDTLYDGCAFLGCHLRHITPESKSEKLPYSDNNGLAITADAIIDNRTELFHLLNIPSYDRVNISDSQLILMAYMKWGYDCPSHLIGDFAFAIWNAGQRELFCARDHVGKRTFYYYCTSDVFAFSTVMKPLFVFPENNEKLNDYWIADFLSLEGVAHEFDCNQTVYENIRQLPPAHTMCVKFKDISKKQYWFPLQTPQLRLKSNKEYEEAFCEIFFEAVECRLRSIGSVGIMLSGGLDSGAVACIAAKQLKERNKRLQAFSAIPMKGYIDWLPKRYIADESIYIEAVRKYAGNMDVTYCRSEGRHSMSDVELYLSVLEQPYKIFENLFWLDDITSTAAKCGCSVLLDGQFGNCTISFGNFTVHADSLFKNRKWISLLKEVYSYSRLQGLKPTDVGKAILRPHIPVILLNMFGKRINENEGLRSLLPVNPEFAAACKTQERFSKEGFGTNMEVPLTLSEVRKLILHPAAFSHIGTVETKLSLVHGLAKRDPTRDKRIIEFCMSLPGEQYVSAGQERYLLKRSMEGLMPDKVRLNTKVRGKQSADWIQRLLPDWKEIRRELEVMLQEKCIQPYMDVPKLRKIMTDLGNIPEYKTWGLELRTLLIGLIFSYFMLGIENNNKGGGKNAGNQ